jgi:hypothetical protein
MPPIRTYTLHDYAGRSPDGSGDFVTHRPLIVTVGTQALEPRVRKGKTLIRFERISNCALLEGTPKMQVRINGLKKPVIIDDVQSVELRFDNKTFLSEAKEMPFWLIESLEFAAKMLRSSTP